MPSTAVNFFLGCDWGTSSFRLRLIEGGSRRVLAEQFESAGVRHFARLGPAARAERMATYLAERIGQWTEIGPEVPFVVTGMASSTVGWLDLPYATVPFALDGSNAVVSSLALPVSGGRQRSGLLVSGVGTTDEIMRGEESALVGLQTIDAKLLDAPTPVICLLAGTHPKHAQIHDGRLASFRTFLTGELFEVLSQESILANSVRRSAGDTEPVWDEFRAGVLSAQSLGLSAALFQVRTRQVLHGVSPERNIWFLSGILIGDELAEIARTQGDTSLCLIGELSRISLYREALRILAPERRPENVHEVALTDAIVAGQEKILRRHAALMTP